MDKNKRQQILIKICCVITSFIMWLYISNIENPIQSYKLKNVPVKLINVEVLQQLNLTLEPNQTFYVNLNLKGMASDVLTVKPDKFIIVADLSSYNLKKGENKIPVKIVSTPSDVTVVDGESYVVNINLDELKEKSVPIEVEIKGKAQHGFYNLKPEYKRKNAIISGASSNIEKVKKVVGKVNLDGRDKEIKLPLQLKAYDKKGNIVNGIDINPNIIDVVIPIKKAKEVNVNVKTIGELSDNVSLKTIVVQPNKIRISGKEDLISNINSIDTQELDLNQINETKNIKLKLIIPSGSYIIDNDGYVNVKVEVDYKTIEKDVRLGVKIKNLQYGYTAQLSSNNATVSLFGRKKMLDNLNIKDVDCYVDLSKLGEGSFNMPIKLTIPTYLEGRISGEKDIKVIIKKDKDVQTQGDKINKAEDK